MGRTVINETENKQKIILNDSPEGVEGGYFDSLMEWHEFGGGGETLKNPKITATFEGSFDSPIPLPVYRIENGYFVSSTQLVSSAVTIETYTLGNAHEGEIICYIQIRSAETLTASNLINCTLEGDYEFGYSIRVTDPNQDASLTITAS